MIRKVIILLGFALSASILLGQQNSDQTRLTYQQWFSEILNCQDSVYELKDAIIDFDEKKDQRFLFKRKLEEKIDSVIIPFEIAMENVTFLGFDKARITLQRIIFLENVTIHLNEASGVPRFDFCVFEKKFQLIGHEVDEEKSPRNNVSFYKSSFLGTTVIATSSKYLEMEECTFDPMYREPDDSPLYFAFHMTNEDGAFRLEDNNFKAGIPEDNIFLSLPSFNLYSIKLFNNIFNINLRLQEFTIQDFHCQEQSI